MKKYLLVFLMFSFVIVGCAKENIKNLDIATINDLPTLQQSIDQVSVAMNKGMISMEQAQDLVDQLQQRYLDLTDTTNKNIETTFDSIQNVFTSKSIISYTLPLWVKKLGMTAPKGMSLNKTLSKPTTTNTDGDISTTLVYTGNYTIALQQAQLIAQKAHLYVSKNFAQAQSLAKIGNVEYISGLDIGGLAKGIVYTNHELLDTNIDYLLSVSVDQNGMLTIETTKYKN